MHDDFVERFVPKFSDSDLSFYCIAALLDPVMKQWQWPGCRRDEAMALSYFKEEYDKNWAPPAVIIAAAPLAATPRAAAPRWRGSMNFAFESAGAAAAPPPGPVALTPTVAMAPQQSEAQMYLATT
jgi:hypothetical protein